MESIKLLEINILLHVEAKLNEVKGCYTFHWLIIKGITGNQSNLGSAWAKARCALDGVYWNYSLLHCPETFPLPNNIAHIGL